MSLQKKKFTGDYHPSGHFPRTGNNDIKKDIRHTKILKSKALDKVQQLKQDNFKNFVIEWFSSL